MKTKDRKPKARKFTPFYSPAQWKEASPTLPIPLESRVLSMLKFWRALEGLKTETPPDPNHWVVLTEAVNLMDAFVRDGIARDPGNLMGDASGAMREAARHMMKTGSMMQLDAQLAAPLAAVLEDFEPVWSRVSQRTFMEVFNRTDRLLWEAAHKHVDNDVEVFDFAAAKRSAS
jgi:hypothetical protein